MADPLSITAGIIAVLQLTTTAVQYLNDVKDAPAERHRILIEVVTVSGFLHTLKDLAESMQPDDLQGSALRSLNVPDGPLEQVKCALERLVSKIKPARGLKRVSTSLTWTLNKADVNNILASIERQKALFLLAMQNDHIGLTKAMTTGIAEIQHGVQELNMAQTDTKVTSALRWLSSTDPSSNHHAACEKRKLTRTTGDWLLKSKEFETWKNDSNDFLWLHGKAGSGKTILCSTVIEATKLHTATLSGAALAYFYFDFNDAEKQHVKGLICSLIAQISHSRPSAAERVRDMYKSCQDGQQRPSIKSLRKCLKDVLHRGPDTSLVIDALDECTQREELLDLIEEICSWKLTKLKILTTSRSERDIEDVLSTLSTCICIQSTKIDSDIRLYVDKRLSSDFKLKKWLDNADLAEEIRIALVNGADGMFQWVVCQMDALRRCLNPNAVRKALKALPKTLDATYDRILNSIEDDYRKEAFSVLQWLAFSVRPMRLEEIAEATSMAGEDHPVFKPEERLSEPIHVLTICTSLVTLTKRKGDHLEPDTVTELRLAHFSVKEYLLSQRIPANLRIEENSAHLYIAKTCLAYLLYFDFKLSEEDTSEEDIADYPLLRYAAEFWPTHVRAISDGSSDPLLDSMTLDLLNPDKLCNLNWLRIYDPDGGSRRSFEAEFSGPPLYYASLLGLLNITRALINKRVDVNAQGGLYGNPLQAAVRSGNEAVIQLLLDAGADVNAQGGYFRTALQAAAQSGNKTVIQLLLDAEADVNAQGGEYGNALQAAQSGNKTVIQLLLDAGADVNAQGGRLFDSALQAAALNCNETVIQLLLDTGADVNAQGGYFGNALQAAAVGRCHITTIQLLLDAGADVNAQGGNYGNALRAACRPGVGNEAVVQLLIDAGADVNAQNGLYGSALQEVASRGNETLIKLLLDAGADVNAQGGEYGTALHAAAYWGNEAAIKLLLEAGADVNARGEEYGSVLDKAIERGVQSVIDLLLAHGAKTTAELESEREAFFHSQSDGEGVCSEEENHSEEDPIHSANATPPPAESTENNPMAAI